MTDLADENIQDAGFAEALSERYLAYALSTIMSRSLPDVRDGLKPVHRRLLYAMRQLRLNPDQGFKKCARIVGDVMGKFHPHGDQAIYDALVRLAQDFAQRYPLIDGQGNFGNVDGDNAAAMRYTEARLTRIAEALLEGIDLDTVDFRDTYDGEDAEPEVLPAAFPNLLANGAQGIAVGMATSIPPHNADELCQALLHIANLKKKGGEGNVGVDTLVGYIPGPDFPTGGVLVEAPESIREAYATGRGSFRLRARWEIEKGKRGTYVIVVTEIPYQVPKARVVEKIADLLAARKLPLLADVRDESAEDVRLVLEPRSGNVEAAVLMEHLFRLTDLEIRFGLNLNVLGADRAPRVMNLREALQAFLDHRHEVLVRRSTFRLEQIAKRLEILEGYLVCYLNLDEVIRIIREEDHPKAVLIETFSLTDNQAEAILNMRLRALRRLEEMEIRKEHEALLAEREDLEDLLGDEKRRWGVIADEIKAIRKAFGDARRTEIAEPPTEDVAPPESLVEKEPITIVCSDRGWLRALRGHVADGHDVKFRDGDKGRFWLHAQTTDKLIVFATNGRFYTLPCDRLPGGRGHGEPVRLLCDLPNDADIVTMLIHEPEAGRRFLVAASDGRGFVVPEADVVAQTKAGKQVLNVKGDVEAAAFAIVAGDHAAVIGENHKIVCFPVAEIGEMSRGRGVTLQRYKDGGLSDVTTFDLADGLPWRSGRGEHRIEDVADWLGKRGNAGRLAPRGFNRNHRFSA